MNSPYEYNFSLKKKSLLLKRRFIPKNFFEETGLPFITTWFLPFGGIRGLCLIRKGAASFNNLKTKRPFRYPCKWRWKDSKGILIL
jgi:hypothetical protein